MTTAFLPIEAPKPSAQKALVVSAIAVLSALVGWLTPLVDDAYIYLNYAQSLLSTGNWGLSRDIFSDTATSPLHVLWLYVCAQITAGHVLPAVIIATAVPWTITAWILAQAYPKRLGFVFTFTALLLFLPPAISSVGMETSWLTTFLVLSWTLFMRAKEENSVVTYAIFGAALSGLYFLRPDAGLFIAGVVIIAGLTIDRRFWWSSGSTVILLAAIYSVIRWFALGSVVPDSLFMKFNQAGDWGGKTLLDGWLMYWNEVPAATILFGACAAAVVGTLVYSAWSMHSFRVVVKTPGFVFAAATAIYLAGALYASVPPYHWYYVLPSVALLLVTFHVWTWAMPGMGHSLTILAAVAAVTLSISAAIASQPALSTNWGSEEELTQIGQDIAPIVQGKKVDLEGEIGTIAYSCDCTLLDEFSYSAAMKDFYDSKVTAGGLKGKVVKVNFQHRDWPSLNKKSPYLLTTTKPVDGAEVLYEKTLVSRLGVKHTYYLVQQ